MSTLHRSTNKSKITALYRQQKHAVRIILFKYRVIHGNTLIKQINVLSIYQLNIFNTLVFIYKQEAASLEKSHRAY